MSDYIEEIVLNQIGALRMSGSDACVYVEDWADKEFWERWLQQKLPHRKFDFLSYTRNPDTGNLQTGSQQCLQYLPYARNKFWVYMDSDMEYLLQKQPFSKGMQVYLGQTYTYAIENHYCEGSRLDGIVSKAGQGLAIPFTFSAFLAEWSKLVYPLLSWHLWKRVHEPLKHALIDKMKVACQPDYRWSDQDIQDGGQRFLLLVKTEVSALQQQLQTEFPHAQLALVSLPAALQIAPAESYLYLRGHDIENMVLRIGRALYTYIFNQRKIHIPPQERQAFHQSLSFKDDYLAFSLSANYTAHQWVEADMDALEAQL